DPRHLFAAWPAPHQKFAGHKSGSPLKAVHLRNGLRFAAGCRMLDPIAGQLERYLDRLGTRQKLAASNIASADTPGYRTQDAYADVSGRQRLKGRKLADWTAASS